MDYFVYFYSFDNWYPIFFWVLIKTKNSNNIIKNVWFEKMREYINVLNYPIFIVVLRKYNINFHK